MRISNFEFRRKEKKKNHLQVFPNHSSPVVTRLIGRGCNSGPLRALNACDEVPCDLLSLDEESSIRAKFCFTNGRNPLRTVIKYVFRARLLAYRPAPLLSNLGNATNLSRIAIIRHAHWIFLAEHLLWRDPKSDGQSRKLFRFWAVPFLR